MREKLHKNRLVSFLVLSAIWCFLVWIIGLNPWFYFGIFIIADATSWNYVIYKKYKRPKVKKGFFAEWVDAIVFAVIAATIIRSFFIEAYTIPTPSMEKSLLVGDFLFVSKLSYGPRVPMTPIAFPFAHHTMPIIGTKAYSELIKLPYHRMSGLTEIKNNDVIVFNYPAGDTILTNNPTQDYYQTLLGNAEYVREQFPGIGLEKSISMVREKILASNPIHIRPLDKKENYIKRCIGIAGDTLKIVNQQVYINGIAIDDPVKSQHSFNILGKTSVNTRKLNKLDSDIAQTDFKNSTSHRSAKFTLQSKTVEILRNDKSIESVKKECEIPNSRESNIFPTSLEYRWNRDNYGSIYIPKAGTTVELNNVNIALYLRIIRDYEHNNLKIKGDEFIINGEKTNSYTFKQNYYFMMGDNRHSSADSRYWGFVPEDHIVGKAVFIWMSWDSEAKNIFKKVRWSRLFNLIH